MKILSKISAALILSASMGAHAGVILDWEGTGVDFYSSWLDTDTLRIEIDAANPSAGWANAVEIDSIAINGSWSWQSASDITLSSPSGFVGDIDGTGLNANGCQGLTLGANHQCWSGSQALADNMFFDFNFDLLGGAVISSYTDNPHLKVRFLDSDGKKAGSLLSQDFGGTTNVPEPSTLLLLAAGFLGLGSVYRVRAKKR